MTTNKKIGRETRIAVRRRVSLGGIVLDAHGRPVTGGELHLTNSAAQSGRTSYSARVRPDGRYFFLDIPPGKFVLQGRVGSGDPITERSVTVAGAPLEKGRLPVQLGVNLKVAPATTEIDNTSLSRRGVT
jgi:hypothetical protein